MRSSCRGLKNTSTVGGSLLAPTVEVLTGNRVSTGIGVIPWFSYFCDNFFTGAPLTSESIIIKHKSSRAHVIAATFHPYRA